MPRVAFVTAAHIPDLHADDRLGRDALQVRGVDVEAAIWTDPDVDWSGYDAIVLRSPWNYFLEIEPFLDWLAGVEETGVPMWNDHDTVRWNFDKRYLLEMAGAGAAIVPTALVAGDDPEEAIARASFEGWEDLVVKPLVSGGAHRTARISLDALTAQPAMLTDAVGTGDALLQPYAPEINDHGESSFLFFEGEFSHALRKTAAPGDFRIQEKHGGTIATYKPDAEGVAQAQAFLKHAPAPPLYARVDVIERDGALLLMELELIEPELFLRVDAGAPDRFAAAVQRRLA